MSDNETNIPPATQRHLLRDIEKVPPADYETEFDSSAAANAADAGFDNAA